MMKFLKCYLLIALLIIAYLPTYCWGFYAHKKINNYAVFLLPPEMMVLYKPNADFITEHSIDPDKRRYAVVKFGQDSLMQYGIVPWHVQFMLYRLTNAFKDKNFSSIMKNSAEIGHYIADAHVPLHANSNHNGQFTNQKGIHGFWESRAPELLADKEWDFFIGKAQYIKDPGNFIWARVLESAKASDSVLLFEKQLTQQFAADKKYSFEERNGVVIKQYSTAFTKAFNKKLDGMIERRMRQSIQSIASFWYTAWVNAGQPNLKSLVAKKFTADDVKEFEELNSKWNSGSKMIGREE